MFVYNWGGIQIGHLATEMEVVQRGNEIRGKCYVNNKTEHAPESYNCRANNVKTRILERSYFLKNRVIVEHKMSTPKSDKSKSGLWNSIIGGTRYDIMTLLFILLFDLRSQ